MEKESFSNLLSNYTSLTALEADQLVALSKSFPYSQVIHNLAARSAQDNNLSSKETLLHLSAIYSTDRSALKSMMTAPRNARIEINSKQGEPVTPSDEPSLDALHERLMNDMAALRESKRFFEQVIESLETGKSVPLKMEKKITDENSNKEKPAQKDKLPATEGLIEEIKITKKKIKPTDSKQIEQIEIIDQFIKTQPSITRTKPTPAPATDLAANSSQFGENIVSETLVEILLKQGKKEKAIEALKKLIWKFPQKKAYFAAQIEELRK
ncbi:MAG: hypothetical protein JST48_14035 [Bacteroidetes bacterium]|nr:hypothetical protein [Bacteroidota bacterium]